MAIGAIIAGRVVAAGKIVAAGLVVDFLVVIPPGNLLFGLTTAVFGGGKRGTGHGLWAPLQNRYAKISVLLRQTADSLRE